MFAVGRGRYTAAKALSPDLEFASPPGTVIAFHWLFMVFASALGTFIVFLSLHQEFRGCRYYIGAIISFAGTIVFYVLYLIYYFSSAEFQASSNVWSVPDYDWNHVQIVEGQPQVVYTGDAEDYYYRCTLREFILQGENATDWSTFPNTTDFLDDKDIVFIKPDLDITWAPGAEGIIGDTRNRLVHCVRNPSTWDSIEGKETTQFYVDGAFVSKSGEVPSTLGKAAGVASGIFFAGALHCYDVDSIPMVAPRVVKKGGMVPREQPKDCFSVGVDCRRRSNRRSSSY
jgi:hypothetical protein